MLEEGFDYWFSGREACVAYARAGGAWIAAGAPLTAPERVREVAWAFVAAAARQGRRAAFFGVEADFLEHTGMKGVQVGEQPSWEASAWPHTLAEHPSLRRQITRAARAGVRCRRPSLEELAPGSALRAAIERLVARWRRSQAMATMGFLVQVELFAHLGERRIFVAEQPRASGGHPLVGVLSMVPVYARGGWLCEDFLRDPDAPNGCVEALVDVAMRSAAAEGSGWVTLGLAPLAGPVNPYLLSAVRFLSGLYDFRGLLAFKAKLRPGAWAPIYLATAGTGSRATLLAFFDSLRAFAPQGLIRFGLETMLRGPSVVVSTLWVLLIPWTLALALLDTAAWFPSPWVHAAWVAFDLCLIPALAALNRRWSPALATVLASVVSLDAVVTLAELCTFPGPAGRVADLLRFLAVGAPSLSAAVLWRARRHRRRRRRLTGRAPRTSSESPSRSCALAKQEGDALSPGAREPRGE